MSAGVYAAIVVFNRVAPIPAPTTVAEDEQYGSK